MLFFSCQPAPFFVLDEIDAALDNTNINNVISTLNFCQREVTDVRNGHVLFRLVTYIVFCMFIFMFKVGIYTVFVGKGGEL